MNKITFRPDDGGPVDFFVLEQMTYNGKTYILVTEEEDGDADALILRDDTASAGESGEETALFSLVEDDSELAACAEAFGKLLGDDDITIETT